MKKKFSLIALAVIMLFCITACNGTESGQNGVKVKVSSEDISESYAYFNPFCILDYSATDNGYFIDGDTLYRFGDECAQMIAKLDAAGGEITCFTVKDNNIYYSFYNSLTDVGGINIYGIESKSQTEIINKPTGVLSVTDEGIYTVISDDNSFMKMAVIDGDGKISYKDSIADSMTAVGSVFKLDENLYIQWNGSIFLNDLTAEGYVCASSLADWITVFRTKNEVYAVESLGETECGVLKFNDEIGYLERIMTVPNYNTSVAVGENGNYSLENTTLYHSESLDKKEEAITGLDENIKAWQIKNGKFIYYISPENTGSITISK